MTASFRRRILTSLLGAACALPATTLAQTTPGPLGVNGLSVSLTTIYQPQVAGGTFLDYTVNFQNLGADTATTVTVIDSLDAAKFNLSTLQVIASSHNVTWQASADYIFTARFTGIQLPPRAADSLGSRGFLRFRVQPKTTLVAGDTIFNRAYVIFDPGFVATTNTVYTVVPRPAGLPATPAAATWSAYPNPTTGLLTVTADLPTAGPVRLELLDLLGRSLQQHQLAAPAGAFRHSLETGAVPAGIYVLRLQLPDGRVSTRQIVRR